MNSDNVLRLVRDIEDVKLFGELYYELSVRKMSSQEELDEVRIKMSFCKDKVVAISHAVNQHLSDVHGKAMFVNNVVDGLKQLGEQARILENSVMKRISLKAKIDSLFEEYYKGRLTFFQFTEMKMRLLQGRTQEQWMNLLDGLIDDSVSKIQPLNKLAFDAMSKETLYNRLKMEATPIHVPERQIVPAMQVPLVVPRPEAKIDSDVPRPKFVLPSPRSPMQEGKSFDIRTVPMPAKTAALVSTSMGMPMPPRPHVEEKAWSILEHIKEIMPHNAGKIEVTAAKPVETKPEQKAELPQPQTEAPKPKMTPRHEWPIAPKIEEPDLKKFAQELEGPISGNLADPLDADDPYVKWLHESGRQEEEERIDRLISELKSQPIETEAKIKVVEELKAQLEKLKQKKDIVGQPLDPTMLEEGHEEYDF